MRSPSMTDFLWGLENSGWLKHIKAILDAGVFISRVCRQTETQTQTHVQCAQVHTHITAVIQTAVLILLVYVLSLFFSMPP